MNIYAVLLAAVLLTTAGAPSIAGSVVDTNRQLAKDLAADGRHEAAAIEYRRLAISEEKQENRAGYYWMASFEYFKAGKHDLVQKMLDKAEDSSTNIATEALLLRAQTAIATRKFTEADFYLKNIINRPGSGADTEAKTGMTKDALNTATRNLAEILLSTGKPADAKKVLIQCPVPCPAAVKAVELYQAGSDRSPKVGGLLGLIPGLGYAYSGEYANALRSLILNGIFIYAMTDTADNEQWGAFAALTFFELTWYSGSIYGGIDSAHRFNQERLNGCIESVKGNMEFKPDFARLPVISLRFEF